MYRDAREVPSGSVLKAQVCIVGAGPAGITLAAALTERGIDVMLLESGGLSPSVRGRSLARGRSTGEPYHRLERARVRAVGGSSHVWFKSGRPWQGTGGMRALRLDPRDFEQRSWAPDSGWPLAAGDLERYYDAAREFCGLQRLSFDPAAWEERGRRIWAPDSNTFETALVQFARGDIFRRKAATLAAHPCMTLLANAEALRLDREETGSISCVEVAADGGGRFRVRAGVYALAAGGIDNPRLLLLSTERGRTAPGNSGDAVGRYFMEHLCSYSAAFRPVRPHLLRDAGFYQRRTRRGASGMGVLTLRETAEREGGLLRTAFALEPVAAAQMSPAVRSLLALRWSTGLEPRPRGAGKYVAAALGGAPELLEAAATRVLGRPRPGLIRLMTIAEQAPDRHSRVVLGSRRDGFGRPEAVLDWRLGDLDRSSLRRAQQVLFAGLEAAGIGAAVRTFGDDAIEPPLMGAFHHMGTTRMGSSAETSVVDANCRVHGSPNLFVAGSSVFPTGGHANPTLTIVALALRLADCIAAGVGPALVAAEARH